MNVPVIIRPMEPSDWPAVRAIYLAGIEGGNATFQTTVPNWEEWDKNHLDACRFVAVAGEVVGWVVIAAMSSRSAYRGVAEVSLYVSPTAARQGVGQALLSHLITQSEALGFWTLLAGIFSENTASLRLHEKCGFRQVGVREKIGERLGVWHDVVLVERRSRVVNWQATINALV